MLWRAAIRVGHLLVLLSLAAPVLLAEDAPKEINLSSLADFALRAGVAGDDLSPALSLAKSIDVPAFVLHRPSSAGDLQLTSSEPALRVHVAGALATSLPDRNRDGVPDRVAAALETARRTLTWCARNGLGRPADDGDGELDLFLLPLAGVVRGYTVLEQALPPGHGASGFAVIDTSSHQDDAAFAGMIARSVARLVFAAHDARAPIWWVEPSAGWVQSRIAGPAVEFRRAIDARWNHPELGLEANDSLLARGNASLLWSLDEPALEQRALAESWRALAERASSETHREALDAAMLRVTGLSLAQLQTRAALHYLASGLEPSRFALEVSQLPAIAQRLVLPVNPGGLALLSLRPDTRDPEGTRLTLETTSGAWSALLVAHRLEGHWDRTTLAPSKDGKKLEIALPWQDYDRAVVLLVPQGRDGAGEPLLIHAESLGPSAAFALSSLAAHRRTDGLVEISWTSAWERELFGWLVEQAPSPEGPWQMVQRLALPAMGLPEEGSAYSLLEERAGDGAFPSYYRVVAVTRDGLRATGPIVAAGGL